MLFFDLSQVFNGFDIITKFAIFQSKDLPNVKKSRLPVLPEPYFVVAIFLSVLISMRDPVANAPPEGSDSSFMHPGPQCSN